MERTGVIVVAGGRGVRMGGSIPKQFRLLEGEPVLARTIRNFARALPGARIVAVLPAEHLPFWRNLCKRFDVAPHMTVEGGAERFHSVRNGLAALGSDVELIAVQDGVRPLTSDELIRRTARAAAEHGAAVPVIEAVDSCRLTDGAGSHIVDRRRLRIVQTPQIFRADILRRAYEAAYSADFTDDASVVERSGHSIFLCQGERQNLKITAPEDFIVARALLEASRMREEAAAAGTDTDAGAGAGTDIGAGTDTRTRAGADTCTANAFDPAIFPDERR